MNFMKSLITKFVTLLLIFSLSACGPTSYISSSWKAANVQPREYKKIVVLGLVRDADRSMREKMEQHIVGDLKELGYDAVCSCDEYDPKKFEGMNEKQAVDQMKNAGVDAVLTIVLLDKVKERFYVPGRTDYTPYSIYHNRFYGYYRTMYGRVYTPGYYTEDTKYFWESNFYDLSTDSLLYSAQSRSFDPVSSETLGHEYGKMIVKDLVKSAVLKDQKTVVLKAM
jgi:hypothetical protein